MGGDEPLSQTVRVGALSALLQDLVRVDAPEPASTWDAALKPGAIIGRFELVREIGRGGFGVVWEARDPSLGRSVALKAVCPGARADLREERLLREAEAAARLSHPNIVTLHDVGQTEHGPYLVLELLRGEPLARRLDRGSVPLREALRVALEAAKGLAHAHAEGVIHRDLTPGNVFLCAEGLVKVLDFGMAHAFGHRKVDGGTRAYMAPEQARGAPEDERTDVFALGVMLYQMLSGELPFPDAEALARSNSALRLEIPEAPALAALVGRMLEKDPVKRPRDASEVLAALTAIQKELEQVPSTGRSQVRTRPSSTGLKDFFAELKRRRVIRALLGWGIFSFAVLQIYEPVMHGLHLPEWTLSAVVVVLASGFPATMVLAWIFDIRSGGIERAVPKGAGGMPGRSRLRGRRLSLLLVGTGVVAAVPLIAWYFFWSRPGRETTATAGAAPAATRGPSIAVLPFVDMSAGHDQEYFSDGIAEEILNALAHVQGLHVTGRTSSFSFKGKSEDLRTIGQKLNVAAVLEGSVRKEGNRVRITAQVVNAADGYHLWSETYDRQLTDVFAVQDEIAQAVVEALKVKLLASRETTRASRRPTNPDVYQQYLLGRDYMRRYSERTSRLAIEAFEKALALDSSYAPAWAGLSLALARHADFPQAQAEVTAALQRSLAAAEKAIALDGDLADGYRARSYARELLTYDLADVQADIERALTLSPGDANMVKRRGMLLMYQGRLPGSVASLQKAAEIDPIAEDRWLHLALAQFYFGDLASAHAAIDRAQQINPDDPRLWIYLCWILLAEGQPAAALAAAERNSEPDWLLAGTALSRHSLGQTAAAQRDLDELTARFGNKTAAWFIAQIHAWRGERDAAFEWLERAYQQHDSGVSYSKCDFVLRPLRGDPRFTALLKKMKLPLDPCPSFGGRSSSP